MKVFNPIAINDTDSIVSLHTRKSIFANYTGLTQLTILGFFKVILPEVGQPMQLPTAFFLQLFDSGTIKIHTSETHATINEKVRELMDAASPTDLQRANRRFNLVQAYFQHRTDIYQDIPQSTLSQWVKQFREAEATFGCGYIGLLPRTASRGNRLPKAPTDAGKLLDQFIIHIFTQMVILRWWMNLGIQFFMGMQLTLPAINGWGFLNQ